MAFAFVCVTRGNVQSSATFRKRISSLFAAANNTCNILWITRMVFGDNSSLFLPAKKQTLEYLVWLNPSAFASLTQAKYEYNDAADMKSTWMSSAGKPYGASATIIWRWSGVYQEEMQYDN